MCVYIRGIYSRDLYAVSYTHLRVEGVVISDICGETADGLIASYRVETPFSEEFGAADARPSDIVLAYSSVSGTSTPETDGEVNAVVNEYALKVDYCVYTDASFSVITDAFSVTHELLTTTESVSILKPALNETVTDRVEGNVTLEVNMPIVDNILAVSYTHLALNGSLADVEYYVEPYFGLSVPKTCPGVESEILDPQTSWADKKAYDKKAKDLAKKFVENFKKYDHMPAEIVNAGPKA